MNATSRTLRIVVLISGGGRTLQNLIRHMDAGQLDVEIPLVIASSAKAKGLPFAEDAGIPAEVVRRESFDDQDAFSRAIFNRARDLNADVVVMGGFVKLLTVPDDFANRVTNIHPALLPSFGGEGMYGHFVHEAVLEAGCKVSGCTVHFADNEYDRGPIIVQKAVPVLEDDTPDTLAARVFEAECKAYPEALQAIAEGRVTVKKRKVRIAPT